jgi:hypothetical protein
MLKNIRKVKSHIKIHKIGLNAFGTLALYGDLRLAGNSIDFISNNLKTTFNTPDVILKMSSKEELQVLVIADTHRTGNFFCDYRKLEKNPDYIAYYFTNMYRLYLIPGPKLNSWLKANESNKTKAYPYNVSSESIHGFIVKIKLLTEEIPEIKMFPMN